MQSAIAVNRKIYPSNIMPIFTGWHVLCTINTSTPDRVPLEAVNGL